MYSFSSIQQEFKDAMEFLVQMGLALNLELRDPPMTLSENEVSHYTNVFAAENAVL